MVKKYLLPFLILTIFSGTLFAGTTGKIVGTITDKSSNELLTGVNIEVLGTSLGASSDVDGFYFVLNVPPGSYTLRASFIGYTTVEISNVGVNADKTTEVNIVISESVLELQETITIVAERPLIQKDATSKRAVVDGNMITDILPVSTINDVIAMQAGVVSDENGTIHIRGGRSDCRHSFDNVDHR